MDLFKSSHTVRCYLIVSLLNRFSISVISAMYVTFLLSKGLDLFWVNMVNFVFFTTLLVFEIPTGALADAIGRKRSVVLSSAFIAVGMGSYGFSHSFLHFAISEGIIAIGYTLWSGAFNAWLHDGLAEEGRTADERRVFALGSMSGRITSALAAVLGALTLQWSQMLPFLLGSLASAAACGYTIFAMREAAYRPRSVRRSCLMARRAIRYAIRHDAIRAMLWLGVLQTAALQAANMQWQPLFSAQLPGMAWLGGIRVLISVGLFAGAWWAGRTASKHVESQIIRSQLAIGACVIVTATIGDPALALIAFIAHEVARGYFEPVKQAFLNSCIKSKRTRATVLSCEAASIDLGGMIGLPLSGAIALHGSIPLAWVLSGAVLMVGAFIVRGKLRCK